MTYATQQDLVDLFGADELVQLTDRANPPAGEIDATVVAKALADADRIIDGYLAGGGIALPLSTVPDLVVIWAKHIARYFLHKDSPTEIVRQNYTDALRQLQALSRGEIKLPLAGGALAAPVGDPVLTKGPDRVFSRCSLKEF